jgi:hypothetical protein
MRIVTKKTRHKCLCDQLRIVNKNRVNSGTKTGLIPEQKPDQFWNKNRIKSKQLQKPGIFRNEHQINSGQLQKPDQFRNKYRINSGTKPDQKILTDFKDRIKSGL